MANVARLGVVLGMDSAEFVKGLESAKREIFNFQNALKAGAFVAFSTQLAKWADDLKDTADAYDTTVGSVIRLKEALSQSGGSAETSGRMLGTFINKLDEAANAGKAAQDSFKKIGVSLDDISKLSSDELFAKTVQQLAAIDDPVRRNAAAFDLFGKSIRGVNLIKLNEELQKTGQLTKEQEAGINDAADSVDMFAKTWADLNRVTAEFIGPLAKGVAQVFADIVDGIDRAIKGIKSLLNAFDELLAKIPRLPANGGDEYDAAMFGGIDTATGGYTRKDSGGGGAARNAYRGGRSVEAAKDSKLEQLLKELKAIEQISNTYQTALSYQQQAIQLQTDKVAMTQNEAQLAQMLYDIDKRRDEQIAQLQNKIDIARETGADKRVIDALQQQIDKVKELTIAYKDQIIETEIANQNLTQSYAGGWMDAFQKYQMMAIDNAAVISQSVDTLFNGMTLALTNFVRTGKLNFKDFATSIIADLMRIQIQAMASKIFSGILGAIGGAMLSSFTNNAMGPGFVGPMPRASGGEMDAFNPYYVGENGPELIVPGKSGTVIPNNKLGEIGGGVTNITNNYIDAIDTKSFEDRLYGSSRAVWAANQYATKNISNSRTRS